jgi:hypothetical protein
MNLSVIIIGSKQKYIEIMNLFLEVGSVKYLFIVIYFKTDQILNRHGLFKLICESFYSFFAVDIVQIISFASHGPFRLPTGVSLYKSWQAN